MPREAYWSLAFAVGSPDWLAAIGGGKADLTDYIHPAGNDLKGEDGAHVLRLPQTVFLSLWKALSRKQTG